MNISQLFYKLTLVPDIEIVVAFLPHRHLPEYNCRVGEGR